MVTVQLMQVWQVHSFPMSALVFRVGICYWGLTSICFFRILRKLNWAIEWSGCFKAECCEKLMNPVCSLETQHNCA